jgi:hypothetical protein
MGASYLLSEEARMARFVVELHPTGAGGVEGIVIPESTGEAQPFSGWLELLRLLEVATPHQGRRPEAE